MFEKMLHRTVYRLSSLAARVRGDLPEPVAYPAYPWETRQLQSGEELAMLADLCRLHEVKTIRNEDRDPPLPPAGAAPVAA